MRDMAVLATRLRRERERETAQVERARKRVAERREVEESGLPTAARVNEEVRGALAPHLGAVGTVRLGRGARSETKEVRLVTLCQAGALGRTQKGCPVWLAYHDLYCGCVTVLDPPSARDAVGRAVSRLRAGAPRGDR